MLTALPRCNTHFAHSTAAAAYHDVSISVLYGLLGLAEAGGKARILVLKRFSVNVEFVLCHTTLRTIIYPRILVYISIYINVYRIFGQHEF